MAWFEGSHTETRTLTADLATALAHIQDPQSIIDATKNVESATLTDNVVHFQMAEEDHGVVKFKADFKCTYEAIDNGIRWTSVEGGNLDQSGEATVTAKGDGCELTYTELVKIDLPVPGMMAPMLKPVIGPMMASEIKDFVKRYTASLS